MKPIAVFQHTELGAPGSAISILEGLGFGVELIRVVDGQAVPAKAGDYAGLVFMGGYMSVRDGLPWMAQECALIRQADALDIPVAGHCLGSQLLAHAFGAPVRENGRSELGWLEIVTESSLSEGWWGVPPGTAISTFQWHGDTFELPSGAVRIASSAHCANQAFVLRGLHLGMQPHFEMTPGLVRLLLERRGGRLEEEHLAGNPAASAPADALRGLAARTEALAQVLARIYGQWVRGCKP